MMKPLLFVFLASQVTLLAKPCAPPQIARGRVPSERLPVVGERIAVAQVRQRAVLPGVAEQVSRENLANPARSYSGVALRVATAPNKAQMINPLAPREYGSARGLVEYTVRDPYRTSNQNKFELQQNGIRLFTIRPLW